MNAKVLLLLVSSAVFALTSGVSVGSPAKRQDVAAVDKNGVAPAFYDGIDLNTLSEEDIARLLDAEDEIFKGYLDIHAYTNGVAQKSRRPKRWIPLLARAAFTAGRAIFRAASRGRITRSGSRLTRQYNKPGKTHITRITRSGSRLTRQYTKPGNYGDAVRDFRSLNPSGVKSISNNKLQGMTGSLGKHRVTVRSSSSNGRPTLEVRSSNSNGGSTVRKFRYDNP